MPKETKTIVSYEESFDRLDIRVGRVIAVDLETNTHKPTYKMTVDFGKYGTRVSYGRFTQHPTEEVRNSARPTSTAAGLRYSFAFASLSRVWQATSYCLHLVQTPQMISVCSDRQTPLRG